MTEPLRYRRSFRRATSWAGCLGLVIGTVLLYRWSDPYRRPPSNPSATPARTDTVTIHMENVPFSAKPNGHKSWSLWAKSVDLEHPPYAPATSFQSATLTDLRDGVLYASSPEETMLPLPEGSHPPIPPRPSAHKKGDAASQGKKYAEHAIKRPTPEKTGKKEPTKEPTEEPDDAPLGPAVAFFHAQQGRYLQGETEPLDAGLNLKFTLQWELKLTGNVDIKTPEGDDLHTEALTILQLVNRRTRQTEQRLQCDSGATITRKDIKILSNRLRYTLNDHTVEFLDGVHGVFKAGNIQSERIFWALKENVIRAPDPSTGVLQGQNFSAESLILDRRQHIDSANHVTLYLHSDSPGMPEPP